MLFEIELCKVRRVVRHLLVDSDYAASYKIAGVAYNLAALSQGDEGQSSHAR
jgi:hypothetical protein